MPGKLSYRMVRVGSAPAGLLGLDELMRSIYEEGICPDDIRLPENLISGVKAHNYIPKPALEDYKEALMREYTKFYAQMSGDQTFTVKEYGTWRGYPREHIAWFPTVSAELCTGCDRCLEFCSYGVYEKQDDGKVIVVEPFLCRVGCSSCAAVCDPNAILFPPYDMLKDYRPIG